MFPVTIIGFDDHSLQACRGIALFGDNDDLVEFILLLRSEGEPQVVFESLDTGGREGVRAFKRSADRCGSIRNAADVLSREYFNCSSAKIIARALSLDVDN